VQNIQLVRTLGLDLGKGESEAIALAAEIDDAILIMDDADGRRVARALGLQVTGVLGVLVEAKERGFVALVKPILDALGEAGFWLGEPLRRTILDAVREQ
jgi:predicted nucleic acid-binding protein